MAIPSWSFGWLKVYPIHSYNEIKRVFAGWSDD